MGSGKSFLALKIASTLQKQNLTGAFIDLDNQTPLKWVKEDYKTFALLKPEDNKQAIQTIKLLGDSVDYLIFDNLALITKKEEAREVITALMRLVNRDVFVILTNTIIDNRLRWRYLYKIFITSTLYIKKISHSPFKVQLITLPTKNTPNPLIEIMF